MSSLAFLGAGAMGEALMRGLLDARVYQPAQLVAYDAATTRLHEVAERFGIRAATSPVELVSDAEVLLLAVKPQVLSAALEPLRNVLTPQQTVISIAAGVTTAQIESCFAAPIPVVRVMPNTPALVNRAASAICLGAHAEETHREQAHRIFDAVGEAVDVEEKLLDAVTGLSGSGPAYVYVFIEALSDAGVRMGLPRDVATRLAAQTVLGSAQMVLETGQHPGTLKDMVTSPGGTTIAGLHALERNAFRGAVIDAVEAATQRSQELSR
jgi:pyrroline-5-carboxylate reductase